MTPPHRRSAPLLALPAALVLALTAGCSGEDPASAPSDAASVAPDEASGAREPASSPEPASTDPRAAASEVRAAAGRVRTALRGYHRDTGRYPAVRTVVVGREVRVDGAPVVSLPAGVELVRYGLGEPGSSSSEPAVASFCLYVRGEDGTVAAAAFGDTETRTAETSTEDPTGLC